MFVESSYRRIEPEREAAEVLDPSTKQTGRRPVA